MGAWILIPHVGKLKWTDGVERNFGRNGFSAGTPVQRPVSEKFEGANERLQTRIPKALESTLDVIVHVLLCTKTDLPGTFDSLLIIAFETGWRHDTQPVELSG